MKKLNCYDKFEDAETKQLQVIYLSEIEKLSPSKISEYVEYALSTIRTYIYKFRNRLEEAKKLFKAVCVNTIQLLKGYSAYLIYLVDKTSNKILFAKVGYSKDVFTRFNQLAKHYNCRVLPMRQFMFDNQDDALTMENEMRKHFKRVGAGFVPNDRFEEYEITDNDLEYIDNRYEWCLANL